MRILQIPKFSNLDGLCSKSGIPLGGLEKTIIDMHDLLLEKGEDSIVVDSKTSFLNKSVEKIFSKDLSSVNNSKNIVDLVFKIKPDVILIHGNNSVFSRLTKLKIPCVLIDHQNHSQINKLYHEGLFLDNWKIIKQFNLKSKFITVSLNSKIKKEQVINKNINTDFKYDDFFIFQHLTSELEQVTIKHSEGCVITIGRCNFDKKPHLIKKLNVDNYKILTLNNELKTEKEQLYFDTYFKKPEDLTNVLFNLDRKTTLDILSKSSFYYSTCPNESAGISAFESLCLGVPLVLNENNLPHASRMFGGEICDYICSAKEKDKWKSFFNFSLEKRQEIASITRSKFSKDSFFNNFKKLASQCIVDKNLYQIANEKESFIF